MRTAGNRRLRRVRPPTTLGHFGKTNPTRIWQNEPNAILGKRTQAGKFNRAKWMGRYGSVAKRSRPAGFSVLASNVRISIAPPVSIVTAMRSSATAVATMRAPFGSKAVTSAGAALPSDLKTR